MSNRPRALLLAAWLAIAGLIAYANSFTVPFLLDDWVTIRDNPQLRDVWPPWRLLQPPENSGVGGRPVANIAFVLNHRLTGDSIVGYHLANLLIHILSALALFGVVRRTCILARQPGAGGAGPPDLIAAGS
ncbi:MAG: hypothetical protein ACKODK_12165, partial [Opitutaceae bacterium]